MNLLARITGVAVIATAITAFIFLMVFSAAGIGPDELTSEDAFLVLFVWAGGLVLGAYQLYASSDA